MAGLHLYRGEAALEAALDELLRAREGAVEPVVELGRGLSSIPRLLADATPDVSLGRAAELLLVHTAAEAFNAWSAIAPSLRPALGRVLASLRRAGVGPPALRQVAPRLPARARADALQLADRLERYERVLGDRLDAAGVERRGLSNVSREAIPSLVEVGLVELHAAVPFDPLTRLIIEALAARGLAIRCAMPEASGPTRWEHALEAAASRALDVLESVSGNVERVPAGGATPPIPKLIIGATPTLEARAIARQVRDRIAAGVAPDAIAVAAPSAAQRAQLEDALRTYDVPVASPGDRRVGETAVHRLLTNVLRLVEQRLPREGMATLLGSPLLEPLRWGGRTVRGARLAALLREALPESAAPASWDESLAMVVASRHDARRAETQAMAAHVLGLRDRLLVLPKRSPIARHLAALRAVIDVLGVDERVHRLPRGAVPDPASAHGRAQADEQAALRMLDDLLRALPVAARQLRLGERTYSRSEVAQLVLGVWGDSALRVGGARGAAVTLCEPSRIPDVAHELLVVAGMADDALRGSTNDPLLHDETILTLGRALDRPLFDGPEDAAHRERLTLQRALRSARRILVTTSRVDDGGRVLLPGALVEWAQHRGAIATQVDALVPHAHDARTRAELATRLSLERHGAARIKEGLDEPTRNALSAALGNTETAALARIERARDAFFASDVPAGVHDGQLSEAVWRDVQPGSSTAPLSASSIGTYAQCGHRFFLEQVLRARPADETTDELDERAGGQLAHSTLESLFSRWRDANLLPLRAREVEAEHIEPAVARAVALWQERHAIGNAVLFEQRRRALVRMARAVWQHECERASTHVPTHFEWKFDDVIVRSADGPIHLRGQIDRIDLGVGSATVFDYKAGRIKSEKPKLKAETYGDTSWQLPLYAAVARERLGVDSVTIVYFSLRDLSPEGAAVPDDLQLHDGAFADKLREQVSRMRRGDFAVRPRADACRLCRMQAVCRIVERVDEEQDET